MSDQIRPLRSVSPFYWSVGSGQLRRCRRRRLAALVGTAVVLAVAAAAAFDRLDVH